MRRLVTTVHVKDDNGEYRQFVPGQEEEMPDWAKRRITNPAAWYEDGDTSVQDPIPLHTVDGKADWSTFNVKELNVELTNRGLPKDGDKADKVARLSRHDDEIAELLAVLSEEDVAALNALDEDDKLMVVMMAEEKAAQEKANGNANG